MKAVTKIIVPVEVTLSNLSDWLAAVRISNELISRILQESDVDSETFGHWFEDVNEGKTKLVSVKVKP